MSKLLNPMSSFSIQAGDDGEYGRSKTLTTIGSGTIMIADKKSSTDIDTINRDTKNSTLDIYDFKQQGADVDMTVDTRLLSEEGRRDIAKDVKTNEVGVEAISDVVMQDSVGLTDLPRHLSNNVDIFNGTQNFAEQNPDLAKIINDPTATDAQRQAAKQQMVNYIANEMGIPPAQVVQAMSDFVPNEHGENAVVNGAHTTDENGQSTIVQNYDPRQVDDPDVDKVALGPSDTAQNVTNLGHENQHAIDTAQGVATTEDYADLQGTKQTDYFSFALDNYNLGEMNTANAQQDAAYISANQNNPTTQAGNVFADGISPEKTDYDVAEVAGTRQNTEDDAYASKPYTIVQYKVYDYDTPDDLAQARTAGENLKTISNDFVDFELTFDENLNPTKGPIYGDENKWSKVVDTGDATKYKYGLIDAEAQSGSNSLTVVKNGEEVQYTDIKIHIGGPNWAAGCGTSPCKSDQPVKSNYPANDWKQVKAQFQDRFEERLESKIPSLKDSNEDTYIEIPKK